MRVNTETVSKAVESRKMTVGSSWTEEIKIAFGDNAFFFSPKDAVEIWRVLKGEKASAEVQCVRHGLVDRISLAHIRYEEDDGYKWKLNFMDEFSVVLDANEALALSWAIEGQVSMEIWGARAAVTENPYFVWVLSCRQILTGDCAETTASEGLGGYERVYLKRSDAIEDVREFMRPLVNGAYSESFWGNCDRNVDDVLDEIAEGYCETEGVAFWHHDGQSRSFEVTLAKREVLK